jgi:hypothetical protein
LTTLEALTYHVTTFCNVCCEMLFLHSFVKARLTTNVTFDAFSRQTAFEVLFGEAWILARSPESAVVYFVLAGEDTENVLLFVSSKRLETSLTNRNKTTNKSCAADPSVSEPRGRPGGQASNKASNNPHTSRAQQQ